MPTALTAFRCCRRATMTSALRPKGFSKADTTVNVTRRPGHDRRPKMAVGASSQTVEVSSAAPLVQADNADLSTNFNQTMIANRPTAATTLRPSLRPRRASP